MRDATELKHTADALAHATAEMEQFASVVSHDLRSPLLAISGCGQLLREQYAELLGEDGHELLGMVQDGVSRMGLMIRDLLAFARATPARARCETVDAEQAFAEALAGVQGLLAEPGAAVTHDPLPQVRANTAQLGHVFGHLLANALKFHCHEPPKVHVSARDRGNEWEFSVRDNGIGIDRVQFEKIFGIFHRLHEEAKYGGGTGIGLAICKKIVEYHGGCIWVESQPGQGSTFFFTLPKPA
jgi:chemotaxis family two-component system sensor kinase Cph1